MPLAHVIYIPGIFLLGLAFGFVWGAKAARKELASRSKWAPKDR